MSERLNRAADYLEAQMRAEADPDPEMMDTGRAVIVALRETSREDLDHGSWASVMSCLNVFNLPGAIYIALGLEEAGL